MNIDELTKLKVIWELIDDLKDQIKFQASGHIYTTIGVLENEASKVEKNIKASLSHKDPHFEDAVQSVAPELVQ